MTLNFIKYKWLYFLISGFFILPSIFSLVKWGLRPAIDFTGGTILEIKSQKFKEEDSLSKLKQIAEENKIELVSIQKSSEESLILKTKEFDKNKKQEFLAKLNEKLDKTEELRFETVGPILGKELIKKTIIAVLLASGFILFYVAYRFKEKSFGVCAILAMFHDTLILLGIFSLLGHFYQVEVDSLFVTAVLTTLSFSVHDTIVVYDRIRESLKLFPKEKFENLVNKAIVETLTRSLNNSMTIIFMLLCLYLLGGESIKWFSFALLIGTICGTYSSTFTAAPLLVVWKNLQTRKK